MKKYTGETGIIYQVPYAFYANASDFSGRKATEDDVFCAWCHKSQAEIKKTEDLNAHIDNHVKEDSLSPKGNTSSGQGIEEEND